MEKDTLWAFHCLYSMAEPGSLAASAVPLHDQEGEHTHFVFVEDVSKIENPSALETPSGTTMCASHVIFRNETFRFRTSGPEARTFFERMSRFEVLEYGSMSDAQRERRREALAAFFAEAPIPVIDIYVASRDEDFRRIRQTLTPGSWHVAVFRDGGAEGSLKPVYYGAGRPEDDEEARSAGLRFLAPVAPGIELRLRDIFSLNHVRDADLDEETGEHGPPHPGSAPLKPRDGGSGVAEELERISISEEENVQRTRVQQGVASALGSGS